MSAMHSCLRKSLRASARGYIVFRDGAWWDPVQQKAITSLAPHGNIPTHLGKDNMMGYFGGTNDRESIEDDGDSEMLTVGTEPRYKKIKCHSEMAYTDAFPSIITFSCLALEPGVIGGDQLLASNQRVYDLYPENLRSKLWDTGLQHQLFFSDAEDTRAKHAGVRTWQEALQTTDRAKAEKIAADREWRHEWRPTGLRLSFTRPAFIELDEGPGLFCTDLSGGWYDDWLPYCVADEMPYSFTWGDGSPFTAVDHAIVTDSSIKAEDRHVWKLGDVLVIDNLRTMHGRQPFDGVRKLGVLLGDEMKRERTVGTSDAGGCSSIVKMT
eukprot:m.262974 g.262974  ORF g.262974 m.262974 type:complete len:325 (-) comp47923_c0_seq1:307-1281(-)